MNKLKNIFISLVVILVVLNGYSKSSSAATSKPTIQLTQTKVNVYVGESKQLTYTAKNINKNQVVWSTNNTNVLTVKNGKVSALKPGTAIVTVSVPKLKVKSVATIKVTKKQLTAKEAFEKVNKSVVYIESYNKYNELIGSGSGFIVSKDGKIVTNHHVVVDVTEVSYVKIKLASGQMYETNRVVGYNTQKDIVILKVDGPTNLPVISLGDSNSISTGDKVYALGSPKGIQNTITEGIISNKQVIEDKNEYIQTTAPINPGNSGGVLVNIYGEVIGINDWTYRGAQNMNYSIPINLFKQIPANSNYQLIDINREYYVPAKGEGTVSEEEDNGTFDYADKIPYSDALAYGKFSNNQDTDYYYFLITDYKNVKILATTIDANYSEDLTFSLYDGEGNFIEVCTMDWDDAEKSYYCYLDKDLEPGYYHIGVYVDPKNKFDDTDQKYVISVKIDDKQ